MIHFWKMNGAGNDFVVVDNRENQLSLSREEIALLCQRQRGIGADGLLAVEPAEDRSENGADYRMRYYNADGGEAEMCGNGARCFAAFVNRLNGGQLEQVSFETMAGVIQAQFLGDTIRIDLGRPQDQKLNDNLKVNGEQVTVHSVNTGVPHAVVTVDDLENTDIRTLGSALRHHAHFAPAGSNINFMQIEAPDHISIRTYERGVEDETLACGTGMVACALMHHQLNDAPLPVRITVRGGDTLLVDFDRNADGDIENATLTGPAEFTFEGTFLN